MSQSREYLLMDDDNVGEEEVLHYSSSPSLSCSLPLQAHERVEINNLGYQASSENSVGGGSVHAASVPELESSEALDILRHKDHGSRAMTLPVRQSVLTRDPFPELASSPMTPTMSQILMDTSARSTPSSSPPRHNHNIENINFRSNPVSRSGSGYDLSSGSRSLSGYDLHAGSKLLSIAQDSDKDNVQEILNSNREALEEENTSPVWTPSSYKNQLLFFYTDDENYRSLVVDSSMLVCDVCHCLVEKNHVKDDINWAIIEHDLKLNLERILEDHENIHAIIRHWSDPEDFRLYFRKDFRKFEPFRNPANFISHEMVDHGQLQDTDISDLLPSAERYNHILLQHLFNVDKLPDVHSHCVYKDSKKSWKKLFCVLKSSGLYYSSKAKSKEAKHLVSVCHLSEVDIHSVVEAKKTYGAPQPYCLCLKRPQVSDVKEMIFLCADDEKSLLCWYTALRLVKFKSQLREDYKAAINAMERSILKENGMLTMEDGEVHQRVAMDFTGTRGRVVEDPSEAFGVACEEAHHWRKKVTCRKVGTDVDLARPAFLSSSLVSEQCIQGLGAGVHMVQPWFHSGISRQEAVDLITKHGVVDGVFLVRESQSINGVHVLSLAHNHKVKHCQIQKVEVNGNVYHTLDGGTTKFTDLIQLVEFYQLNAAGLPTKLAHYVTCLP